MITKAVIPAAGLGTRLLPATKEQPKEMLPIFSKGADGKLFLKPFLQVVYEELHDTGFREFCFIVGKGKRSIEDHFTIDDDFLKSLRTNGKIEVSNELSRFYEKIRNSTLVFTNQPRPLGFGNAVYQAKFFTGDEAFMVHAGDDSIISNKNNHLRRLVRLFEKNDADAAFLVKRVDDPTKYGVILGEKIDSRVYRVKRIAEKPSTPLSDIGTIAIYIFNSKIYQAIEHIEPDRNNEIQLTDAIQQLVDQGCRVYALELNRKEKRIDVGTPESYREAFICASNSQKQV